MEKNFSETNKTGQFAESKPDLKGCLHKCPCFRAVLSGHAGAGLLREVSEPVYEPAGYMLEDWLDAQDVMRYLHISPRTLQTLRTNGTLPFSRIGNKLYYLRQDVERILRNNYVMFKLHVNKERRKERREAAAGGQERKGS